MKSFASSVVPRFFAPMQLSLGAEIDLPERVARHCAVLRLRRGDAVVVFNGEGGEFSAELTRVSRGDSRARVISKQTPERESPLAIALAQCVSSGDRMDSTLRKSDRKSTRLNSSHGYISYAVFCLKKKKKNKDKCNKHDMI